ncbi:MAG: Holliday junction resolvase-like protein [Nanoarchaeota archaeon]
MPLSLPAPESLLLLLAGFFIGLLLMYLYWKNKVPAERQDAINRSRANLSGQFAEQLAPYFPDFPYSPTELRWLGKPIDYVVFKGMDNNDINEIVFLEVKSGKSQLNEHQRQVKRVVEEKKISWSQYKVLREVVNK